MTTVGHLRDHPQTWRCLRINHQQALVLIGGYCVATNTAMPSLVAPDKWFRLALMRLLCPALLHSEPTELGSLTLTLLELDYYGLVACDREMRMAPTGAGLTLLVSCEQAIGLLHHAAEHLRQMAAKHQCQGGSTHRPARDAQP